MFFYSNRELTLFSNGSFGYNNPKSKSIKLLIKPDQINRLERNKATLTIYTNVRFNDENTFSFRFPQQQDAITWFESMNAFLPPVPNIEKLGKYN